MLMGAGAGVAVGTAGGASAAAAAAAKTGFGGTAADGDAPSARLGQGRAHGRALRLGARASAGVVRKNGTQPMGASAATTSAAARLEKATIGALQEFFAIAGAAGVIASTPHAERQETSFSTVAALAGDAPLLLPFSWRRGGKMRDYELRGNGGHALRGVFWIDDLLNSSTFVQAVTDPSVRYHAPRAPHTSSTRGGARARGVRR